MEKEKLKTLKDFNEDGNSPLFTKDNLKQEAIKWVKYWENKKSLNLLEDGYLEGKIDATIELNNITSENLK